jgi:hypothetical protein
MRLFHFFARCLISFFGIAGVAFSDLSLALGSSKGKKKLMRLFWAENCIAIHATLSRFVSDEWQQQQKTGS